MKIFEHKCVAYLKRDLKFYESLDAISKYINFSIMRSEFAKQHTKEGFKHYSFSGFQPKEGDVKKGYYKSGETYTFTLRSLDEAFLDTLTTALRQNIDNPQILVVQTAKRVLNQHFISELYSVTPVIVTASNDEKGHQIFWTIEKDGDILKLQNQLQKNLLKKYESYYGKKLEPSQNFIQLLEIKNKKPQNIVMRKKDDEQTKRKVTFFGNKFKIVPNEDAVSQKLALVAMACGLGEKNSYGGGFCLGKGMR